MKLINVGEDIKSLILAGIDPLVNEYMFDLKMLINQLASFFARLEREGKIVWWQFVAPSRDIIVEVTLRKRNVLEMIEVRISDLP